MKIVTENHGKFRGVEQWTAYDEDTYDGPGSAMGYGDSAEEAVEDLLEKMGVDNEPQD